MFHLHLNKNPNSKSSKKNQNKEKPMTLPSGLPDSFGSPCAIYLGKNPPLHCAKPLTASQNASEAPALTASDKQFLMAFQQSGGDDHPKGHDTEYMSKCTMPLQS
jgi:hypothetical protein